MALLANDLIMLGTSIQSFRHLEHQNPSIISGDISRARSVQQFRNGGGVGSEEEEEKEDRNTVVLEDRIFNTLLYCTVLYSTVLPIPMHYCSVKCWVISEGQ